MRLGKTICLPESVVVNVFATAADVGIELLLLLFLLLVDYCCVANWNCERNDPIRISSTLE